MNCLVAIVDVNGSRYRLTVGIGGYYVHRQRQEPDALRVNCMNVDRFARDPMQVGDIGEYLRVAA